MEQAVGWAVPTAQRARPCVRAWEASWLAAAGPGQPLLPAQCRRVHGSADPGHAPASQRAEAGAGAAVASGGTEGAGPPGPSRRASGPKGVRRWGQQRGAPPTRQQLDLNHELHHCASVEQMLAAIEHAKAKRVPLNTVNIITAINKTVKLNRPGKSAGGRRAQILLQQVLLRALTVRLATNQADIGSHEIATLAWSLAKLNLNAEHAGVWQVLEHMLCTRGFKDFSPRALSTCIWALSAAGRHTNMVMERLEQDMRDVDLSRFDWQSLSTLLWSLAAGSIKHASSSTSSPVTNSSHGPIPTLFHDQESNLHRASDAPGVATHASTSSTTSSSSAIWDVQRWPLKGIFHELEAEILARCLADAEPGGGRGRLGVGRGEEEELSPARESAKASEKESERERGRASERERQTARAAGTSSSGSSSSSSGHRRPCVTMELIGRKNTVARVSGSGVSEPGPSVPEGDVCVCVCVYRVYTSQGDLCACVCVCVCVYHWYWQKLLDKRKALYYKHKELTKELTMGRFAVKVIA